MCPHVNDSLLPVEVTTLIFTTKKLGLDIPPVTPTADMKVPGISIAGELNGIGHIRRGIDQRQRVIGSIRKNRGEGD